MSDDADADWDDPEAGVLGTRAAIHQRLRADGAAWTVRDVAEAFAIHPNVARTHLQRLAEEGLVRVAERKRPEGGRPARVYQADPTRPSPAAVTAARSGAPQAAERDPAAQLLVRLLAELAERPARGAVPHPLARAHEAALAEGQRLTARRAGQRASGSFVVAAGEAIRALGEVLPAARVIRSDEATVDVAGVDGAFRLLGAQRPRLARALERGLVTGALAGLGYAVAVAEQETGILRLSPTAASGRAAAEPATRLDVRGLGRDEGVARARRALQARSAGEVLEVVVDEPGAPAAFARWVDRAGHRLLAVERITERGAPAVRLRLRRGG